MSPTRRRRKRPKVVNKQLNQHNGVQYAKDEEPPESAEIVQDDSDRKDQTAESISEPYTDIEINQTKAPSSQTGTGFRDGSVQGETIFVSITQKEKV
jgi:hypothetical protein